MTRIKTRTNERRSVRGFTVIEIMIVIAIIGIVVAIAAPTWVRARSQSRMKTCQENLSKLDSAKEQWALANNKTPGAQPLASDFVDPGYLKAFPREPSGATGGDNNTGYTINPIGTEPVCLTSGLTTPFAGHTLSEIGLTITEIEG